MSDDKELNKYNSECRNLILNIRPTFAIVVHDENIEEFTGTPDYPLLNMIEDTDLHNHVNSLSWWYLFCVIKFCILRYL